MRNAVEDARAYDEWKQTVGWQRLYRALWHDDRSVYLHTLARRLMTGWQPDLREIDFHRGFYEGVRAVLERPEEAEQNLELVARRAWQTAQLAESEEEPPYV